MVREATKIYGTDFNREDPQVYMAAATAYYNTLPSDYPTMLARRSKNTETRVA